MLTITYCRSSSAGRAAKVPREVDGGRESAEFARSNGRELSPVEYAKDLREDMRGLFCA
jgi:hypothetical protein